MKNYASAFIIIILFLVGCQADSKIDEEIANTSITSDQVEIKKETTTLDSEPAQKLNWIIYEGFIGLYQKHVVVSLSVSDDNQVTGRYFYDKHQKYLDLNGNYHPKSGNYELAESYNGKPTGVLSFKNFNGILKGHWAKSKKDKDHQELELKLLFQAGDKEPEVSFLTYKMKHEIGIYNGEDEDFMDVTDVLKIAKINTDYYSFSYSLTRRNGHTGSADGVIRMDKNSAKQIGHFYGEDECDLVFEFSGKKVNIEEHDCEYYHGANAYMDGSLSLEQ